MVTCMAIYHCDSLIFGPQITTETEDRKAILLFPNFPLDSFKILCFCLFQNTNDTCCSHIRDVKKFKQVVIECSQFTKENYWCK